MTEPTFHQALTHTLSCWRNGERVEGLGSLLGAVLRLADAERALLVSVRPDGGYRIAGSRNLDGESVADAERSVSHFAITRASEAAAGILFADTRVDRRFRTESERAHGFKIRSIWVAPLSLADPKDDRAEEAVYLYLDSRFREIQVEDCQTELALAVEAVSFWWGYDRHEREIRTLERRVERLRRSRQQARTRSSVVQVAADSERELDYHGFVTRCPELIADLQEIGGLARSTLSLLIEGETGTGKEVLARALHLASGRTGDFVSLHCGSIPPSLVEVELFGHAKGAFTGADSQRTGLIELARGGTLFLDDIGNMTPEMQNALLRVLETRRYRPLSDPEERDADLRVLASRRLGDDSGIEPHPLREDLYFRLAGARVRIPPLRDRGEDIPLLSRLFLSRHAGDPPPELEEDLRAAFLTYHWPGNTRELENVVRRLLALGASNFGARKFAEITGVEPVDALDNGTTDAVSSGRRRGIQAVVDRAEREAIIRALHQHGGNKSHAAKALGLSRKTLYRRMEKHGIPL